MNARLSFLLALILIILVSCDEQTNDPNDNNGSISLDKSVKLTEFTIGSSSVDITISEAGPLEGLRITAPEGTFNNGATITVAYSEIKSHKLGEKFKPIAPLIKIASSQKYSDRIVFIEIPVPTTQGSIPLAFYYNDKSSELEPIPIIGYKDGKLIIALRNFGQNSGLTSSVSKFGNIQVDELYSNIVLSEVKESDLLGGNLSTGFVPGIDDWEFTNWGTVVAPKGACSGQSLTELWYFSNKKPASQKGLYGQFDYYSKTITPDPFWEDNPLGLKFASVVQNEDLINRGKVYDDFYNKVRQIYNDSPYFIEAYNREGIKAAAAQMWVTGKPLYVIISDTPEMNQSHAVVGYSIDYGSGVIKVADPNFPGNKSKEIKFKNGNFETYYSGSNAADAGTVPYKYFGFWGMSALYNWDNISFHWDAFQNKTIGNKIFPKVDYYTLDADDREIELPDAIPFKELTSAKIMAKLSANGNNLNKVFLSLYVDGDEKARSTEGKLEIEFYMGQDFVNKRVGIYIWELTSNNEVNWIDFKYIKISDLKIDPIKLSGEKNVEYTWKAIIDNPPTNARYEWNFGDGSSKLVIRNNKQAKHKYKDEGLFPIILELYDDSNGNFLTASAAYAIIGGGLVDTNYVLTDEIHLFPSEEVITFNIRCSGTISANNLYLDHEQTNGLRDSWIGPIYGATYHFKAEMPSDLSLELDFDWDIPKVKFEHSTGSSYGIYKYVWEVEPIKSSLKILDPEVFHTDFTDIKIDSSGTKFKFRGKINASGTKGASFTANLKYKIKETNYHKDYDGTLSENIYIGEYYQPASLILITFDKK